MASDETAALRRAIRTTPIIDNHAHPLLKVDVVTKRPLLSIASEAQGAALRSSTTSLAHVRAVKQLSNLLGCESTWDAVTAAIDEKREGCYDDWIGVCLSGIQCVLVDDGLDSEEDVEPYKVLDKFTTSPAKRIVRIEHVAAGLIEEVCVKHDSSDEACREFVQELDRFILEAIRDPEVVGFKSVICYRTGLAISRTTECDLTTFGDIFSQRKGAGAQTFKRVNHRGINDYLVNRLALLIRDNEPKKPIQFHTGLGDNDMTLTTSSPSHLQDFIRRYPAVPMVLLHSGYPFVCEAGYLAAMYVNVYADIGEVFPFLSRDGQESVVRQMLGLCPWSKMLWSTDGHWFPETYLLAVVQMREVFETVLCSYVHKGDLRQQQAVQLVQDVLFNNSNKLYRLNLEMHVSTTKPDASSETATIGLEKIQQVGSSARFLRVCWIDMTATPRMRAIPIRRVVSMLQKGESFTFGVTKGAMGITQTDCVVPGATVVGEWRLHPDLNSLRLGPRQGQLTVMSDFKEEDGSTVTLCPRTLLQRALAMADDGRLSFALGFEIEVVLLRRTADGLEEGNGDTGHAWATVKAMDCDMAIKVMEQVVEKLDAAGVLVEVLHAESAPAQYEVVLPRAPPLEAVDTLLFARNVISCCAELHGYRATLHPKPDSQRCGTASHVHMSMTTSDASVYEPFYAGILKHLRAITAFTLSNPTSYDRVADGYWAGGRWITWGTQNREAPLRKIQGSHWEIKCMDGLANPYLAMSAILLSGLLGLESGYEMRWKDCVEEPARLSDEQRKRLGIVTKLPTSLDEALVALEEDQHLRALLGEELTERYVAVKRVEMEELARMDKLDRWRWISERY
ncbi:hypothetical protein XA68_10149 [Ophiocordyceps unilateralis]|uniref:Glutamine synthetase n=1 Tax=Ophiocordyceps unilateralis TaxID=268505 RepID=A0A2A9PI52_OPHUN|nr:hypothetical protein XA68_10149 [Ophiocordyceps unilateralis]